MNEKRKNLLLDAITCIIVAVMVIFNVTGCRENYDDINAAVSKYVEQYTKANLLRKKIDRANGAVTIYYTYNDKINDFNFVVTATKNENSGSWDISSGYLNLLYDLVIPDLEDHGVIEYVDDGDIYIACRTYDDIHPCLKALVGFRESVYRKQNYLISSDVYIHLLSPYDLTAHAPWGTLNKKNIDRSICERCLFFGEGNAYIILTKSEIEGFMAEDGFRKHQIAYSKDGEVTVLPLYDVDGDEATNERTFCYWLKANNKPATIGSWEDGDRITKFQDDKGRKYMIGPNVEKDDAKFPYIDNRLTYDALKKYFDADAIVSAYLIDDGHQEVDHE